MSPTEAAMSAEADMPGKTVAEPGMAPMAMIPAMMPTAPAAIVEIDRAIDRIGISLGVRRRAVIGLHRASGQEETEFR